MELDIESILAQVEYHKMPFQYARTLHTCKLCTYYDFVDCKILATSVIINNMHCLVLYTEGSLDIFTGLIIILSHNFITVSDSELCHEKDCFLFGNMSPFS